MRTALLNLEGSQLILFVARQNNLKGFIFPVEICAS